MEPAILPEHGAAIPAWLPAVVRGLAIALAAVLALLVLYAYRQPEFLIDFVNLRLC